MVWSDHTTSSYRQAWCHHMGMLQVTFHTWLKDQSEGRRSGATQSITGVYAGFQKVFSVWCGRGVPANVSSTVQLSQSPIICADVLLQSGGITSNSGKYCSSQASEERCRLNSKDQLHFKGIFFSFTRPGVFGVFVLTHACMWTHDGHGRGSTGNNNHSIMRSVRIKKQLKPVNFLLKRDITGSAVYPLLIKREFCTYFKHPNASGMRIYRWHTAKSS